tara:strand:- start:1433 stop:1633 length:201 start_codon:yes stop_codon:yes gene_type:complete
MEVWVMLDMTSCTVDILTTEEKDEVVKNARSLLLEEDFISANQDLDDYEVIELFYGDEMTLHSRDL